MVARLARAPRPPQRYIQTSTVKTLPSPVGGWNARDSLANMKPDEAIQLDNFIPDISGVRLREGYTSWATGLGGPVLSLMEYNPPGGSAELFGATETFIWDVTDNAAATSVVSGMTSGRWQHTMFATTGGNYLVAANGSDPVKNYNGTWSSPSITGVTSSNLINVAVHAQRLWFVEKDTLDAWYLPVSSISGAATKLPLGPYCKLGGHLVAVASWTRDGGSGIDDLWVGITSKGEAVLYSGTDPDTDFQKIGTFRIPEPVGYRCVVQTGADLGIITSQGVLPLSAILPLSPSATAKVAITDKISKAVADAYSGGSTLAGWQLIEYPKGRLLILNVPIDEGVTQYQYVMNTQTGKWCRFTNINAGCWSLKDDGLYFGDNNGTVWKYGDVFTDDGDPINAVSVSAFTTLGTPANKSVIMARPMFTGPDAYLPLVALKTDYDTSIVNYQASSVAASGSFWDSAEWDVDGWAVSITSSALWQSVSGLGSTISFAVAASVSDQFQFNSVDLMFEVGGYL